MKLHQINILLNKHLQSLPNAPPMFFDNSPPHQTVGIFLEAVNLPDSRAAVDFCQTVRQNGIYSVNVFAPLDKGAMQPVQTADDVAVHLSFFRAGSLQCLAAQIERVGRVGNHFVFNVSVPWHVLGDES